MVSFISAGQKKNDEVLYIYTVRMRVAAYPYMFVSMNTLTFSVVYSRNI